MKPWINLLQKASTLLHYVYIHTTKQILYTDGRLISVYTAQINSSFLESYIPINQLTILFCVCVLFWLLAIKWGHMQCCVNFLFRRFSNMINLFLSIIRNYFGVVAWIWCFKFTVSGMWSIISKIFICLGLGYADWPGQADWSQSVECYYWREKLKTLLL
jgi:hypothetical protein